MEKIIFIGSSSFKTEFAQTKLKDVDGRSDKGKKRDPNKKFKKHIESDEFKNTLKRNYTIASVIGTAAGLGIGGYALYRNKKLLKGNIVMPKVPDNPLPHLNPKETFKDHVEKVYETGLTKDLLNIGKKKEKEVFKNTGGWLLRKPKANLKIKSQIRSINTETANVRSKLKTEEQAQRIINKYKNRLPTIKGSRNSKKFKFKSV